MWRYSEGNRKTVILFWCMFALASLVPLSLEPLVIARIMDTVQQEGVTEANLPRLFLYLVASLACTFVFWSLHGPARVMEMNNAFLLRMNYRRFFLNGVMHLPMQWHNDNHSGDTIDRIEKGTSALYLFSEETYELLYTFANLIICCAVLAFFSLTAGALALVFLVISVLITIKIDTILVKNYAEISRGENKVSQAVFDALSNITTVVILRIEKLVLSSIVSKMRDQQALTFRTNRLSETKWFLTSMCCALMTASVLGHYFWTLSNSNAPVLIGTVYLLMSYLKRVNEVFFRFTSFYSNIVKWRVRAQNAEHVAENFAQRSYDTGELPHGWQTIEIKSLGFAYPDSRSAPLTDISMSLTRGSRVAFVGESGSGKTTLLKLIRGLFKPKTGEVWVDGVRCQNGFEDFCDSVALVPQNPEIFQATILHNITLGAQYTEAQLAEALRISRFDSVIPLLPKGLDSLATEKGVNLSGGQGQRLALARGLLESADKQIVAIDEPTSGLDSFTERQIYESFFRAFEGRLVISALHKLHLLPLFDHIFVFESGQVIASGTLPELLNSCPQFKRMWDAHGGE